MAKQTADTDRLCRTLLEDARKGIFKPVYLLMGDEPYYIDLLCDGICDCCLEESERDFNQIVCYGADVTVESVVTAARRFPMFAPRQLVVLKEAQMMRNVEDLSIYAENPLETTVLVICMKGSKADRRRGLYKAVSRNGVVVESPAMKDYQMPQWISSYYAGLGLSITPDASSLLAEYAGTDLSRIAVETTKLLRNLPEGTDTVTVEDIETNVGISRQFTMFELDKALSYHNAAAAVRIASNIASAAKFAMPAATAVLYGHFNRILKLGFAIGRNPGLPQGEKAALLGVNPYYVKEYEQAVKWYPVRKAMAVIALILEYDFRGKGGDGELASQSDLLMELVARILTI